jgi:hypothetical protein
MYYNLPCPWLQVRVIVRVRVRAIIDSSNTGKG